MSVSRWGVLALCLALLALLGLSGVVAEEVVPLSISQTDGVWRPAKPVVDWSTEDVALWLNYTIGYGEYAAFARKHRVDGLTLLEMDAADFESFFPVENALHAIKISAHLSYLQGRCRCDSEEEAAAGEGKRVTSFTQYLRAHPVRTWVEGSIALYFPRWSMVTVFLFDKPMYRAVVNGGASASGLSLADIARVGDDEAGLKAMTAGKRGAATAVGSSRPPTWKRTLLFWASFVVAPDLYMAYMTATHIQYSYFYMGFFTAHFLFQAFNEYVVLMMIYRKTAFEPNTSWLQRIWQLFSYTLLIPLAAPVVAYALPSVIQILLVWVLMANTLMMVIGLALLLIGGEYNNIFFGTGPAQPGQAEGNATSSDNAPQETPYPSEEPAQGEGKTEKID